eukprot:6176036-Pleurochrysis_carterae.AAC.2
MPALSVHRPHGLCRPPRGDLYQTRMTAGGSAYASPRQSTLGIPSRMHGHSRLDDWYYHVHAGVQGEQHAEEQFAAPPLRIEASRPHKSVLQLLPIESPQ